jgi:peptide/nickel transport system ATP-binding protein
LLALMGLLPPGARVSGEATLASDSSAKKLTSLSEQEWRRVRGGQIAMIFQEPMTSLNPVLRIGAQIGEAIRAHHRQLNAHEVKRKTIDPTRFASLQSPNFPALEPQPFLFFLPPLIRLSPVDCQLPVR